MTSLEKITALRRLMKQHALAAYIVPTEDPHLSEYVPECWKRRVWLTDFTGSAGTAVVTQREAGLWTDSRYHLQAERQVDSGVFDVFRFGEPGVPPYDRWLAKRMRRGQAVGIDPRVISNQRAEEMGALFAEKGIRLRFLARNLVDRIWPDRPALPQEPIVRHAQRFAGETVASKLMRIRAEMVAAGAEAMVLTLLDEVAWLFNIRSRDVEFTPLVIAYAILTRRGAELFLDRSRLSPALRRRLRRYARVHPYDQVGPALRELARRRRRVLADPESVNRWVVDRLKGADLVYKESPVLRAKAVKNPTQVQGMRACHIRDGVALVRFFHWVEKTVRRERVSEFEAAMVLDALRAAEEHNQGPSFATIVSFGPNGAMNHYRPKMGQDVRIRKRGILLVDSGGQYLDGTTDVTRTVTMGTPTRHEKAYFTHVLKAHIQLSQTSFPQGTKGIRIEAIAKREVWNAGLDYAHGTGHGVGHYLSVHEGPVGFGRRSQMPLEVGNVVSIEPGYYEPGRFGFRTENLVVVVRDPKRSTKEREWRTFEPLTMCPIDRRLIDRSLLSKDERDWVNDYHRTVYRLLARHLEPTVRRWLHRMTRPI